jgi:hypothetical protein
MLQSSDVGENGIRLVDGEFPTDFVRTRGELQQLVSEHGAEPAAEIVAADIREWYLPNEFSYVVLTFEANAYPILELGLS